MSLVSSFAYNGQNFSVVNDDCICFVAGNAVCIWNTTTGKKEFIHSKRYGYTVCAANYSKGLIACGEYGLNPEIHIYRFPGLQLKAKIKAETKIQCMDLIWNRNCTRLMMIGDKPDYKISIYDFEKNRMLTIDQTLKDKEYLTASFNPSDPDQFLVASPAQITFFNIIKAFQITEQDEENVIDECERVNSMDYFNENPDMLYTCIIWDAYSKIYVATNQMSVMQIDFNTGKEENIINTQENVVQLLLTQKHLIVSLENGMVYWYIALPPEVPIGQVVASKDQLIQLQDEIVQEFTMDQNQNDGEEKWPIQWMQYVKNHKKIVIGCTNGFLSILPVEAEVYNEEEEDDDRDSEQQRKTITTPLIELGQYHTGQINGVKELGGTTQVTTISDDNTFCIWEITNGANLARINIGTCLTTLEVNPEGNVAVIGSIGGVVRMFDISNRCMPRLVQVHKIGETPIKTLAVSPDKTTLAVICEDSTEIVYIHLGIKDNFDIIGFQTIPHTIVNICWTLKSGSHQKIIGITSNSLLFGVNVPFKEEFNKRESVVEDYSNPMYRKIDRGMEFVMSNYDTEIDDKGIDQKDGEIFVTGSDKWLKQYELPNEIYDSIEWRKPANAPINEFHGHGLATNCWTYSVESQFIITGGKDGSLIFRRNPNYAQKNEFKAHTVYTGGVSALSVSRDRPVIYSAGGDGTFFVWAIQKNHGIPAQPQEPADMYSSPELNSMQQLENLTDEDYQDYKKILEEEFLEQQIPKKEKFKLEIGKELDVIKQKLNDLLQLNQTADEIEQLDRDEFVIDIPTRDNVIAEGEKECSTIRANAARKGLELRLLRDKTKQTTWDIMEVKSTAACSLNTDRLIFNYAIRMKTEKEDKRLRQILNFRKIEIRDIISRLEKQEEEILNSKHFSKTEEGFLMNRSTGEQVFEKDDEPLMIVIPTRRRKKEKVEEKKDENVKNTGKRVPKISLEKFRLGANRAKPIDDDEDDQKRDRHAMQSDNAIEELRWKISRKKKTLEEIQKDFNKLSAWDLLYDAFELYTDGRKRMQIEILQQVVTELKVNFNKEFLGFQQQKEDFIFTIKERNDRITEILECLKEEEELFKPNAHPLETPEQILKVDESEIKVEKYLTKEEREVLEAERLKEEERLRALEGDNVGQRGLKSMMNGYEMKKDKNILEEELEREEWMNKPIEEMSEEEKLKFKEFEQKEKELKEERVKQRKAWHQELNKLRIEIEEICFKFEEALQVLHKKRLYYDMRIYEQELYIIRLTLMIHENNDSKDSNRELVEQRDKLQKDLEEKEITISKFYNIHSDLDNKFKTNSNIAEQEKEIKRMFQDSQTKMVLRSIQNFVKNGAKALKRTTIMNPATQKNSKESEMIAELCELDPLFSVDKTTVKKICDEENAKESYNENDNTFGLPEDDFERLIEERLNRVEMEKERTKMQDQIKTLYEHINYLEFCRTDCDQNTQEAIEAQERCAERIEELKYNFEMIVYMLQGQVEVPQQPVTTDYKDSILVQTAVIEKENKEIIKKGEKNVDLLEKISTFKTDLSKVKWQKRQLDLIIHDLHEKAIDVQMYRVTKLTQEIIMGKPRPKEDVDKKRLEGQIKQLEDNCNNRIRVIQDKRRKLRKEIKEKKLENDQLEVKARQLQINVFQRQQIIDLRSKGTDENVQDPARRFKEIAAKRKLVDLLQQQTEEIDFLRDELDRHRAKTFPSFAHIHAKQNEFPDDM